MEFIIASFPRFHHVSFFCVWRSEIERSDGEAQFAQGQKLDQTKHKVQINFKEQKIGKFPLHPLWGIVKMPKNIIQSCHPNENQITFGYLEEENFRKILPKASLTFFLCHVAEYRPRYSEHLIWLSLISLKRNDRRSMLPTHSVLVENRFLCHNSKQHLFMFSLLFLRCRFHSALHYFMENREVKCWRVTHLCHLLDSWQTSIKRKHG